MKILIAGGTGFIGSNIAKRLKNGGHSVSTLSRHGDFPCDVTQPEQLKNIPWDQFDALVICVQFPNHPVQNYKKGFTYERFDAQGTENICNAMKNSKIRKVLYLSGAGTKLGRTEPWFKAKLRAEAAVKNINKDYTILQPSWVYGPHDKSMSRFLVFTKLPFMPVIGDGKYRCAPLFIDDLSRVIEVCITSTNESLKNISIEVGGPKNISMTEIQKTVLKFKNKRRLLVYHPLWFMKVVGHILSFFLSSPPLSAEAVDFVTMDQPVDTTNIDKFFGFSPRTLEAGLIQYK